MTDELRPLTGGENAHFGKFLCGDHRPGDAEGIGTFTHEFEVSLPLVRAAIIYVAAMAATPIGASIIGYIDSSIPASL
jgi:hypothetical protein